MTKNMTTTNVNFTNQKNAGAVGLDRSPSPGSQAHTGWDTCPALLALLLGSPLQEKTSGTEVRRTPDIMKVYQFQFRSCSIVNVHCCLDSVIFNLSSWFGHVSIPLNKQINFFTNHESSAESSKYNCIFSDKYVHKFSTATCLTPDFSFLESIQSNFFTFVHCEQNCRADIAGLC